MSKELEILAKNHEKWINIVESMGCNPSYSEDIVQEAYIRMDKYISKGTDISYNKDDVNTWYFYLTLRSVYIGSKEKKSVSNFTEEFNIDLMYDEIEDKYKELYNSTGDCDFDNLIENIFKEVNSWEFYHKNMFIAYFTTDASLRKISSTTNIGTNSIYNSTKKYKEIIINKFQEDYNKYIKNK
jgi:hypothetical protein